MEKEVLVDTMMEELWKDYIIQSAGHGHYLGGSIARRH